MMELIDFLSHKPRFYIGGESRFYSKIGFTLSLLSLATIFSLVIYFIIITFTRTTIFIRYSTSAKYEKLVNLTDTPMLFSILDYKTQPHADSEKIYNFYLTYTYFIPGDRVLGTDSKWDSQAFLIERCKREHFNGTLFGTLPNIEQYFCVMPGTKNLTLFNEYGNTIDGFANVNIMINRCTNSSLFYAPGRCADSQTINEALTAGFLTFMYLDSYIDHNNATQPNIQYIAHKIFDLSTLSFQRIYINFKNVVYESENGFVFESVNTVKFIQYDSVRLYSDNRKSGYYPETFSSLNLNAVDTTDVYNRSYIKLQTLLANIGGVVNGILTIAAVFMNIFTKRMNLTRLIDCVNRQEEERQKDFSNVSSCGIIERSVCYGGINLNVNKFSTEVSPKKRGSIDENRHIQMDCNKSVNVKEESLKMSFLQYICPFGFCNPKQYLIEKYKKLVRSELSIDNLINKSGEVNKLVELLSYEEKVTFKRLNALNLSMMKISNI
jgi:hypothetical protein